MEEEDLVTKESKMTMRSHGVRLGGKKKTGLKQLVGHGNCGNQLSSVTRLFGQVSRFL